MKQLRRIVEITRNLICVAAVLLIIAVAAAFVLNIKPAVVMSGSMEPTIPVGSVVFIDGRDRNIEEEDIIAFKVHDELVMHRVTGVDRKGIRTKGDGNDAEDIWIINPENVVGKVKEEPARWWIPKAGYFISWLSTKQGTIVVMTLCILMIMASFLTGQKNEKQG